MSQDKKEVFETNLRSCIEAIRKQVISETGDWTVKGFIDVYKKIYTISLDTKVLSKVLELLMFPVLQEFAAKNDYELVLTRQQNHYPDLSFVQKVTGEKFALDIKSTFRKGKDRDGRDLISGMTLGAFMGYFRNRKSKSIITFPYDEYLGHYVLGVIYEQVKGIDERQVYSIEDLAAIPSVAKNFDFFVQEKYRIAADYPGSGNTKNIGSTRVLARMTEGKGVFAPLGLDVFDDYWMNYSTKEMARADGLESQPYKNLIEYREYKQRGESILKIPEAEIVSEELEIEKGAIPKANGEEG